MSRTDDQIHRLSDEFERLTGKQGLLYISRPSPTEPVRYVFGGDIGVQLGATKALSAIAGAVAEAK